jgi:hypothetical protein
MKRVRADDAPVFNHRAGPALRYGPLGALKTRLSGVSSV